MFLKESSLSKKEMLSGIAVQVVLFSVVAVAGVALLSAVKAIIA